MKRFIFIIFLSLSGFNGAFSQLDTPIDSIKVLIEEAENDSLKMQWYNELRKLAIRKDIREAQGYTEQYLQLAEKLDLSFNIGLGHAYLGNTYVRLAEYEKAIEELLLALQYFESMNDSVRMGSIYNSIGASYENMGSDSLTQVFYQKSHDIFEALGDAKRTAIALNNLSNLQVQKGNFSQSESLLNKAAALLEGKDELREYITLTRLNLANTKIELGKYPTADTIYQSLLLDKGVLSNYYNTLVINGLGKSQLHQQKYLEAIDYFKQVEKMIEAHGFLSLKADLLADLSQAYEGSGNISEAFAYYKTYTTFKDSLESVERTQSLDDALQKYEAEKKDQEIITQRLKLRNLRQLLAGIGLVFVLAVFGLILWNRSQRLQSNLLQEKTLRQELEINGLKKENQLISMRSILAGQEAERERIARDLHDNIGSMVTAIKLKLMAIQDDSRQLDDMVGQVSDEVRRISHNMTPLAFGLSGLKGAVEDLCQQLRNQGLEVENKTVGLEEVSNEDRAIMLYRVFQELVNNIIKHSEARQVIFNSRLDNNQLIIQVKDDGKGLDLSTWEAPPHLGLKNIKSRIRYLEGSIALDQSNGTLFNIQIPLEKND